MRDRVAVITGAGSGIGLASAVLFAREGARVVAGVYESGDEEVARRAAGGEADLIARHCDVRREEDVAALVEAAIAKFGRLDILVNNAGIMLPGTVDELSGDLLATVLDVNLKGVLLGSKHAVPHMLRQGGGAIVNVSSINGIRGNHRLVAYAASKGGVVAATMAMALDYAGRNIRVNCVCPGTVEDTRMLNDTLAYSGDAEKMRELLAAKHPMGRPARPAEVAAAILFLASDEASFITGEALPVDGGRSIR